MQTYEPHRHVKGKLASKLWHKNVAAAKQEFGLPRQLVEQLHEIFSFTDDAMSNPLTQIEGVQGWSANAADHLFGAKKDGNKLAWGDKRIWLTPEHTTASMNKAIRCAIERARQQPPTDSTFTVMMLPTESERLGFAKDLINEPEVAMLWKIPEGDFRYATGREWCAETADRPNHKLPYDTGLFIVANTAGFKEAKARASEASSWDRLYTSIGEECDRQDLEDTGIEMYKPTTTRVSTEGRIYAQYKPTTIEATQDMETSPPLEIRERWTEPQPCNLKFQHTYNIYTDGSYDKGIAGAGIYIEQPQTSLGYHMPEGPQDIGRAELCGLREAVRAACASAETIPLVDN
jgi:hypothetical protein